MKQKLFNLKSLLLLMLMCVSMGAWADVITFTAGTDAVESGTSITKNGISLTATNFNRDDYYQAYSGTPLKVVSTVGNITKVEITCISSGTDKYGPSYFSLATTSTGKYNYSGKVGTWTGNATSLSLATSAQVRMTKIEVTTDAVSTPSYALNFANNAQGTFSATVEGKTINSGDKVEQGKTVTLSVNPVDGYAFNAWNVYKTANQYNYVSVSENNTFEMPSEAVTVNAYFMEAAKIPSITAENVLSLPYTEDEGTFKVTWTAMEEMDVNVYSDAECQNKLQESWFVASLDDDKNVEFLVEENTSTEARTVYMQLYGMDSDAEEYTKVVAVTQEGIPMKYTVTIEEPINGTLKVMFGDTPVKSGDQFYKGDKITATATPADGYKFRNLQFTDTSLHNFTASNVKEWSMGEHDIIIKANFDEIPKFTIAFSINGSIVQSEEYEENAVVTVPEVDAINGKAFVGWVGENDKHYSNALTAPVYISPTTATADVTYYAVFATLKEDGGGEVTEELTNAEMESLSSSNALAYNSETTYIDGDVSYSIYAYTDQKSRKWIQQKKDKGVYVKMIAPAPIKEVIVTITSPTNSSGGINDITKHSSFSGTVALTKADCAYSTASESVASTNKIEDNMATLIPTGDNNELYLKVSTGARIWSISVTYGSAASYSGFTTTPLGTEEVTVSSAKWATHYTDKAFVMPEGLSGYIMKDNGTKVASEKIYEAGDVVPAETAIMIKGEAKKYTLVITNEEGTAAAGNLLKGKLEAGTTDGGNEGAKYYKFANGEKGLGWYYGSANNTTGAPFETGAKKAYLVLNAENQHNAKNFVSIFNDDDETNAITNVNVEANNGRAYNLNGQLVKADAKGIVIINGRKYLKK